MTDGPRKPDRRAFGRRRSCIHAMALVAGRPPSPCIIRNFSASGALLELNESLEPPFNFRIKIDSTGEIIECELRHARGNRIGAIFRGPDIEDVIERALGGVTRRRSVRAQEAAAAPMPRVTGQELRRSVLHLEDV